jgi:hypothetical protein
VTGVQTCALPISLQAVSAALGTALGLGQAVSGMIGQRKAKKEFFQSFDKQRTYKADPEIQKMLEARRGRLGMGIGSASRQIAEQGIASSAAQATSAAQQMGRGAGLSAIGAIQKQSQRGATQLAAMDEQAREQNLAGFERAAGAASSERARQFASESEKEQAGGKKKPNSHKKFFFEDSDLISSSTTSDSELSSFNTSTTDDSDADL